MIQEIQKLVGNISPQQMRYVDAFVEQDIAIFMPIAGPCEYARTPEHIHPAYMVLIPFTDTYGIVYGEQKFNVRSGKVMVLAPNIPHHEIIDDDVPKYLVAMVAPERFDRVLKEYGLNPDSKEINGQFELNERLLPLFRQFIHEKSAALPGQKSICNALCEEICHATVRSMLQLEEPYISLSYRIEIEQAINYMYSHLHEKLSVDELAERAAMSVSTFMRTFKKETQQTPVQFLNEIRLNKARKMLLSGDFSMQDIAGMCGFSSQAYLSVQFQKRFKRSPLVYRKQLLEGKLEVA